MFSDISNSDPKYLYKYCALNSFALQAVANGHFWYSKLSAFNDPFEARAPRNELATSTLYDQILQSNVIPLDQVEIAHINNEYIYERNHHDSISVHIDRSGVEGYPDAESKLDFVKSKHAADAIFQFYNNVGSMGVLCLSSDPASILMWSHYADNHCGVCIQIEREENSDLRDPEQVFKVNYSNEYPTKKYLENISNLSEKGLRQAIVARKGLNWSYEKEWRVLKQKGNRLYNSPGKITGVVFGLRTSFSQKAALAKLIAGSEIQALEIRRKEGEYTLEVASMGEP